MKKYFKPVTASFEIQSADCFMSMAGSGDHVQVVQQAPKRKNSVF